MARLARVVIPGVPHHVTQRGNRRQRTFYHDTRGGTVRVGFKYDYDPSTSLWTGKVGNPDYGLREHQSNYGDEYVYDNLYRLTRSIYDDSTPATPTASPAAPCAGPRATSSTPRRADSPEPSARDRGPDIHQSHPS